MVFSSTVFLFLFFPTLLLIYYNPFFKNRVFRNMILFLYSLLFYAWGEPVFVFLMLFSIFVTWILGLAIEKHKQKILVGAGIIYNVILLFVFKYLTFLMGELKLLANCKFSVINISLPIGISFFTFQMMSYILDVYTGKVKAQKNIAYVGLYVSLFPQLIAGPIVRYAQIADEILSRQECKNDITEGMERFIFGLGKKILIANYMAQIADNIFAYSSDLSVMTAWLGAIAYTIQIYYDFSGYSDMAIGLGRMFGFHFTENFNYPYIAKSVTDFWRRWHISLSSWFRDYVYIPLGGNRTKRSRWVLNLFIVWILTGIWHGANWTFIIWGLIYFLILLMEKLTGIAERMGRFSYMYTMFVVIIAWVIFRSDNIASGIRYIGNMIGIGSAGFVDTVFIYYLWSGKIVLIFALFFIFPVYPRLKYLYLDKKEIGSAIGAIVTTGIFILSVIVTISSTYNPFIYFNF